MLFNSMVAGSLEWAMNKLIRFLNPEPTSAKPQLMGFV